MYTKVSIIDDNGPLDKLNTKSGKEISGKWFKVKVNNLIGWVFGSYLSIINNNRNMRVKPNFNKMKLQLNSRAICCDCGPYTNFEEIILSNGKVLYTKIHGWEESEKIIQEGKCSTNDNLIVIRLNEGRIYNNSGTSGQYELSNKKSPSNNITLEWNEELKGFITPDMKKYLENDNFVVNIINAQFVSVSGLIFDDLCHRGDYQDFMEYSSYYYKNNKNNSEMIIGYYYEIKK